MRYIVAFLLLAGVAYGQEPPGVTLGGFQVRGPKTTPVVGQSFIFDSTKSVDSGWANELMNQFRGMSVISNRSCHCITSTTSSPGRTTRSELVSPVGVKDVVVVYEAVNTVLNGESPFPNSIYIKSALERQNYALNVTGASLNDSGGNRNKFSFNGQNAGLLAPRQYLFSDRLPVSLDANKRNFVYTFVSNGWLTAPAAPTVANAAGGFYSINTYAVGITIMYPGGYETPGSASTSVTTTSSNKIISITAPSAATYPGAIAWRAWVSFAGQTTPLYDSGSAPQPMGGSALNLTTAISASYIATAERVLPGSAPLIPQGGVTMLGSTGAGGSANGEYVIGGADATGDGFQYSSNNSVGGGYSPLAILGTDPQRVRRSLWIGGDSIATGSNTHGFMNGPVGGWLIRAVLNQSTSSRIYDPTVAPLIGHIHQATVGETAAMFATQGGFARSKMAAICTDVALPYGSNDIAQGNACTALVVSQLANCKRFTDLGRTVYVSTITPRTGSTDAWQSLANQTQNTPGVSTTFLPGVRQWNNLCLSPDAASAVVTPPENLMGLFAGARAYNFNWFQGGDGTVTTFVPRVPFVQGTETIKVNGVTKALTTDYTYYGSVTINGTSYASGVTFVSAPVAAATVTATYTSMPGFRVLAGPLIKVMDTASLVTVNSAGTADPNGGLWRPGPGTIYDSGTTTGSNTTLLFNTGKSWTQDQYRGYVLYIVTDSSTPAAAGQVIPIAAHTSGGAITVVSMTACSGAATYRVIDAYTTDGTHPSDLGGITMQPAATAQLPTGP
jgi:hypothetical protein